MNRYLKQLGAYAGIGSMLISTAVHAAPLGGQVTAGSAQISQSGATTTITQQSANASLSWQGFNVSSNETVNFVQPNSSAIAVNRILGNSGSQIFGHLNANGQVWLINPNGILFGQGSQINVGGLVASTLDIADSSITSNTRQFKGNGLGSIINQGSITAANGGYIALLGNQVSNQGYLTAQLGTVALGAGSATTLTFNGNQLLHLQVDESTLNNLAENKQLIQADGGEVIMSAGAKDSILASVVNNTGTVQAQTVENHNGTITLLGGMTAGTTNVDGTLDASAPNGGNGGFIETSAANVNIADTAKVTTLAPTGTTGTWLIDPHDYTVAATGGDQTGAQLTASLNTTNVTLLSSSGAASGNGNININDVVSWSAHNLTLTAANDINVNAVMTASGTASLDLNPATANGADTAVSGGTVNMALSSSGFTGRIDYTASGPLKINGTQYTVINSLGSAGSTTGNDLQGISGNLSGHYVLGSSIDASATAGWNSGAGFTQIGNNSAQFSGVIDGLGHEIGGLKTTSKGFLNYIATSGKISNLALTNANVGNWADYTGIFASFNAGSIHNIYSSGSVYGGGSTGGLVGDNLGGSISNSISDATVSGYWGNAGGLVGTSSGSIISSQSFGSVTGQCSVGGLVGYNQTGGTIDASYSSSNINHIRNDGLNNYSYGGLVGNNQGVVLNSNATGSVNGINGVGGLVGVNQGNVTNSYASGGVTGTFEVGGLVGNNGSPYIIFGATPLASIVGSYANGNVSGNRAIGGLVGSNAGSLSYSYSNSNNVSGNYQVGGLVGYDSGHILNSHASGFVSSPDDPVWYTDLGGYAVGGLVGHEDGIIDNSYSTASVNSKSNVGGLVGTNYGTINNSYASGPVTAYEAMGGLVGTNNNTINSSYASGAVTDIGAFHSFVGGLVGQNTGGIYNSYATGDVYGYTGLSQDQRHDDGVGGLVGQNYNSGIISNSFATGAVSGYSLVGGLAGWNQGSITNSYWNKTTSGQSASAGGVGLTTAQMQQASNFSGFNFTTTPGASGNNWVMVDADGSLNNAGGASGATFPMLASEYSTNITNAHQLQLMAMGLSANYTLANNINAINTNTSLVLKDVWSTSGGFVSVGRATTQTDPNNLITAFIGSFDGLGHTINNLYINNPSSRFQGLFGAVLGSIIQNVGLVDSYVTGYDLVGALAGVSNGNIINSYATGVVNGYTNVGGLVGINANNGGSISNGYFSGIVAANTSAGGLVGQNNGLIISSYSQGQVSGADSIGGLVGTNLTNIQNSSSSSTVTLTGAVLNFADSSGSLAGGGLVGYGDVGSSITNSHASGNVSVHNLSKGSLFPETGGLVGWLNGGSISNSYATGNVDGSIVGGLVGQNYNYGTAIAGTISNSYATGAVHGDFNTGGLVGATYGSILDSYATGVVSGNNFVGGLVGFTGFIGSNVDITNSYASGNVTGTGTYIGGLVGYKNAGLISNSFASGNVTGYSQVGGLVGSNAKLAIVDTSYAAGCVNGTSNLGGLTGFNAGIIQNSFATGEVTGIESVGGLVGANIGRIASSYSTGAIIGGDSLNFVGQYTGGLVGTSGENALITDSYSTSNVIGYGSVGGLVGWNNGNSTIQMSYSSGEVQGGYYSGGLVGRNSNNGTIANSHSSSSVIVGSYGGGGLIGISDGIVINSYAIGNVFGQSQVAGLIGTSTGSITNSYAIGNATGSYHVAGLVGWNSGSISNSYASGNINGDYWIGGLVGYNAGSITNTYAAGGVIGNTWVGGLVGENFTTGSVSSSYAIGSVSGYNATGGLIGLVDASGSVTNSYWNITTSGQASSSGGVGLTTAQMQQASNFSGFNFTTTPSATGNNWVMVDVDGSLNNAGGASGATFPILASEYSTNITNAHQLQLMAMNLSANYILSNNINAANTNTFSALNDVWSTYGGFVPIGNNPNHFNGVFDGAGHTISNLYINRPYVYATDYRAYYQGLFGVNFGTIENVGLIDASVTGFSNVGGLVGWNNGLIDNSYVTGTVNATNTVGGLVGYNTNTILGSHTDINVSAINTNCSAYCDNGGFAGGLVGTSDNGYITNSYSLGYVTAGSGVDGVGYYAGGLVGSASTGNAVGAFYGPLTNSLISNSYSTATVDGYSSVGGLVGWSNTSIINSHATGNVTANNALGGLIGFNGFNNPNSVVNSYSTGNVSGFQYVGGLIGFNYNSDNSANTESFGHVLNSYSSSNVTGTNNVGGLIGANSGLIENSNATGEVSGVENIGGLAGYNDGKVIDSFSSNSVNGTKYVGGLVGLNHTFDWAGINASRGVIQYSHSSSTVNGINGVGGLVGLNQSVAPNSASILNSYATGSVSGTYYVGGLVGYNEGSLVANSWATGSVVGDNVLGGLVGQNVGIVLNSYSTGSVKGTYNLGGLIGYNLGDISHSYSTGSVFVGLVPTGSGGGFGGLVGNNLGKISYSFSNSSVSGTYGVGGLIGYNSGEISYSYATGSVTGAFNGWGDSVGGLVGASSGNIFNSFATAIVSCHCSLIGGLVGNNLGSILNTYASGTVDGWGFVGGLVGSNNGGSISNSYANGSVQGLIDVGGLVSTWNTGIILNSFWNTSSSGQLTSGGGVGLTSSQMMQSSSFSSWNTAVPNTISNVGGSGSIWRIYEGHTAPLLTAFMTDLTLPASDTTHVYNGLAQTAGSITPIAGVLGSAATGTNVGFYNGYYSTQLGYNLIGGNTTITPKTLTVLGSSVSNKVYDGTMSATVSGGTLVGVVNGDAVTLSQSGLFTTKNVGTAIAVTATDSLVGNTNNNYILTQPTLSAANITPRVIILTGTRVYDGTTTAAASTLTASNLVLGDTLTLTGSVTLAAKNVGTQNITVKTALLLSGNSNYTLTGSTGSVSITPKALTVTGTKVANKVYNGTTAATLSGGVLAGVVTGDRLTLTQAGNFATKNAGTGIAVIAADTITGTGATNYILTQPTGLTANITPKALTVTGTRVANKVYDGTITATVTTGVLSGLIAGDVVTLTQAGTFSSKNAGTNLAVTIADTITGTGASNYTLTQPTGLRASITPRPLIIAGTRLVNGSTSVAASVLSVSNLIASDVLTLGGSVTVASALAGTRAITSFTALTLAGASAANYTKTGASGAVVLY